MGSNLNTAVGVTLIVVGLLVLVGRFSLSPVFFLAGLILLVLGILVLAKKLPGSNWLGIGLLLVGLLLLWPGFKVPSALQAVFDALEIVIGIVLIVFGVLRLTRA